MRFKIIIVLLFIGIGIQGQNYYGFSLRNQYTIEDIEYRFRDNEIEIDDNDDDHLRINVLLYDEAHLFLQFDTRFCDECDPNTLTRICAFRINEDRAREFYELARRKFGNPSAGFEEEYTKVDELYYGPSIIEKRYRMLYYDKFRPGDLLIVKFDVKSDSWENVKLKTQSTFDIIWHTDASWIQLPERNSRHSQSQWRLIREFNQNLN